MTITLSTVVTPNQGRAGSRVSTLNGYDTRPNMYQPTITEKIAPNKTGTNNMVYVQGRMPLVVQGTDGVWKQTNLIKVDVETTALQNVNADEETLALLSAIIEVLTERKAQIADGFYA